MKIQGPGIWGQGSGIGLAFGGWGLGFGDQGRNTYFPRPERKRSTPAAALAAIVPNV